MATPENRADLRNLIRARISSWPDDQGTLNGGITSTATTITLTATLDIAEKGLLQIDDEILRVKSFSGTSVTVLRGDKGSTPASHIDLSIVKAFPSWGWPDFDINREIDLAIDWLWPDFWILKTLTNTFLANNTDFGLPDGAVYPTGDMVKRVELLDTSVSPSVYREILGWKHAGDRLILERPLKRDYVARIWLMARPSRLLSDSAQLEEKDPVEAIVLRSAASLLEQLLANRVRYVEYSAALNDRASTPDELQRQAYYFKNQAVVERDRISNPPLSGMASTRRSG